MLKYKKLIDKMTLEEKAGLCSGQNYWCTKEIKRLNIPSIMMTDGPNGLRVQRGKTDEFGIKLGNKATCFPTESTISNSWNINLIYEEGKAIAEEAKEERVSMVLAPGVNIKRSPLCGRNFEYFSEDPFLAGKLGIAYVKGMQDQGIGACVKHFAANNQEERRMTIDVIVDERTLREIYLTAFEMIVKEARPWAVMSAYNRINGEYCTENKKLLGILREEWGHQGIVVTDWGAENDRVKGLMAGNDLEMPATDGRTDKEIVEAVKQGKISEEILNETVDRMLEFIMKSNENLREKEKYNRKKHKELAQKLAEESIILLKNESSILPIKKGYKIALIGDMAKYPRYQGAGSSITNPEKVDSIYECLKEKEINFEYEKGYDRKTSKKDKQYRKKACEIAKEKDVVLLCIGLTENEETEGMDRRTLKLSENQVQLIEELKKVNSNIVVILCGGAPIEMPWIQGIKGIVHGYLGGQAGARAMVNVLLGEVNPSGKLAETYPMQLEDTPCFENFPGSQTCVEYKEGIYVGYRYYDKVGKRVLFPFGYGLSYTEFEYSNLEMEKTKFEIEKEEKIKVKLTIKNIGKMSGSEIVELYVSQKDPVIFKPKKELKGFEKVFLAPEEEKEIIIELDRRAFSYYDVEYGLWKVESGIYDILIGKSSEEIILKQEIEIISSDVISNKEYPVSYQTANLPAISDQDFAMVLGRKHLIKRPKIKKITEAHTMEDAKHTLIGGAIYYYQSKIKLKSLLKKQNIIKASKVMMDLQKPLRVFARKQNEIYNQETVAGFIKVLNGHWIKGVKQIYEGRKKYSRKTKNGKNKDFEEKCK